MRRKLLQFLFLTICCVCLALGISACGGSESGVSDWENGIFTVETAYAEAQELGYNGTLAEFISSISGQNGVGISSVKLNDDGELVIAFTDASEINLGVIKGEDGKDGRGISSVEINADGELVVYFTDSTSTNLGVIKGEDGEDGEDLTAAAVTLSFDLGYETEEIIESIQLNKGDSVDLSEPEREGYLFLGWYYGTGANAGQVTSVTPISRDMTLTARWEKVYNMEFSQVPPEACLGYEAWFYGTYEGGFASDGSGILSVNIIAGDDTYTSLQACNLGIISGCSTYCNMNGEFEVGVTFEELGEYALQVVYGNSSAQVDVTVGYFLYSQSPSDEIYTSESVQFTVYYRKDIEYDYPTVTVESGSGYSYTYDITGTGNGYALNDADNTTYIFYERDDSYNALYAVIYFYKAGEYTVTITYGEDSTSFDVSVEVYPFDGEIGAYEEIYVFGIDGYSTVSDGEEVQISDPASDELGFRFNAPADAEVTVSVDGDVISSEYYYVYCHYNDFSVYAYPGFFMDAGTHELTVTVAKDGYGSASLSVTCIISETSAYVSYIFLDNNSGYSWLSESYSESDGADVSIEGYIPADLNGTLYMYVYAADAEVTVTINDAALTEGDDYTVEQNGNMCLVSLNTSLLPVDEIVALEVEEGVQAYGAVNNVVVTAVGGNGTAKATFDVASIIWGYEFSDSEINEGESVESWLYYYGGPGDDITITIAAADSYSYTYTFTFEAEDYGFYYGDYDIGVTVIQGYAMTGAEWGCPYEGIYGNILFYAAGEYTITVSCGGGDGLVLGTITVNEYDYEGVAFLSLTYGDYSNNNCVTEASEEITISGTTAIIYYFIPLYDGTITIYTESDLDTCGYLYQGDEQLLDDDDGGDSLNFLISYDVTAGTLYAIHASGLSDGVNGSAVLYISGVPFVYGDAADISLVIDEDITLTDYVGGEDNGAICLTFNAAKDFVVTVKVGDEVVDLTENEDAYSYELCAGTLTVYVYPRACTGGTAGEYAIEITVSSETYSAEESVSLTYTLAEGNDGESE